MNADLGMGYGRSLFIIHNSGRVTAVNNWSITAVNEWHIMGANKWYIYGRNLTAGIGYFRIQSVQGGGHMTVRCLLARTREGGSGSTAHKRAKMGEIRLVKSDKMSEMQAKSAMYKLFASLRLYTGKGQKAVETL